MSKQRTKQATGGIPESRATSRQAADESPLKPGQPRNADGSPSNPPTMRELAQVRSLEAVEVLVEIMQSKTAPAAARVSAANAVLDRAFGKPQLHVVSDQSHQLTEFLASLSPSKPDRDSAGEDDQTAVH